MVKVNTIQPPSLESPPPTVSENLKNILNEISKYKSTYINDESLTDNNPSSVKRILADLRKDAKDMKTFISTHKIPPNVSASLKQTLETMLPMLIEIGSSNSSVPSYWVKVLLEDLPFTQNTEHVLRQLHKNSTQPIDIEDDGSFPDPQKDEW